MACLSLPPTPTLPPLWLYPSSLYRVPLLFSFSAQPSPKRSAAARAAEKRELRTCAPRRLGPRVKTALIARPPPSTPLSTTPSNTTFTPTPHTHTLTVLYFLPAVPPLQPYIRFFTRLPHRLNHPVNQLTLASLVIGSCAVRLWSRYSCRIMNFMITPAGVA